MPADDQVGLGVGRDPGERAFGLVLVEVLVDPARRPVDEQDAQSVGLEPDLRVERSKPRLVGVADMFLGPRERASPSDFSVGLV